MPQFECSAVLVYCCTVCRVYTLPVVKANAIQCNYDVKQHTQIEDERYRLLLLLLLMAVSLCDVDQSIAWRKLRNDKQNAHSKQKQTGSDRAPCFNADVVHIVHE
jgi:hypothetical protein